MVLVGIVITVIIGVILYTVIRSEYSYKDELSHVEEYLKYLDAQHEKMEKSGDKIVKDYKEKIKNIQDKYSIDISAIPQNKRAKVLVDFGPFMYPVHPALLVSINEFGQDENMFKNSTAIENYELAMMRRKHMFETACILNNIKID